MEQRHGHVRSRALTLPACPNIATRPIPKTKTAVLQDTGALLTIPEGLARLVLYQVEAQIHNLSRANLSDEQWIKVQTLDARLAMQQSDHVTNVVRPWKKVMGMKREEVQEVTLKDLRLLRQHRNAEAAVVLEKLAMQMSEVKMEDEQTVAVKDEDEDDWHVAE